MHAAVTGGHGGQGVELLNAGAPEHLTNLQRPQPRRRPGALVALDSLVYRLARHIVQVNALRMQPALKLLQFGGLNAAGYLPNLGPVFFGGTLHNFHAVIDGG